MRSNLAALPLALLLVGFVLADEPKGRPPADKSAKAAPEWDVDEFIKDYDKDKDGMLSREELPERFRHNFARIDTDKDGKLSRDELCKGAAFLHSRRRPSDVLFHLVEMSDCEEGCAEEIQRIYAFLRKMDTDKDGKIGAEELKAAREGLAGARADRIIKELDADRDGKISREEAKGQIRRHFADLDANKDGFIDRAELLRAALEHPKDVSPRKDSSPRKKASDRPDKE